MLVVLVKLYLRKLKILLQYKYAYYILLFVALLYMVIYLVNYVPLNIYDMNDEEFELTIKEYKVDGDKLSIEFNEYLVGNYYFKSEEEKENFKLELNDMVCVIGQLNIPNNNTTPNTFNYKNYLYRKGILYTLNIEKINLVKKNNNIFYKLKNYIYKRISSIDNNEYLFAFIIGKTFYIDENAYENYKINGITHLFSLSAMHVSVFSSLLFFILKKLKISRSISLLIVSSFLIFFSFISSFTPSLLRATIFFIISNLNKLYKLKIENLNILYVTFCILIFINPNYVYNLGFLLSFTITFFILLFNKYYHVKNNILNMLFISIISLLSSFPIIINMSYEINIIGFLNNLLFIPLVSYIIFPLSLITFFVPNCSNILSVLVGTMEKISCYSGNTLNLTLIFSKMSILLIIIYYVLLILIICLKKHLIPILIFYILFLYNRNYFDKNTYIYFLDVGQGDSALIVSENNMSILIDTGGKISYEKEEWRNRNKEFDFVKSISLVFYKSIGLKNIDYLFLTHGDYDHMGYAKDIINNFDVNNIFINNGKINELENKVSYQKFSDSYIKIDNIEIYSLNNQIYDNENDNSIVFLIIVDNYYKFLFMGDASIEVEEDLIKKYNLKDIDVLKVGHHGSNTSTSVDFIEKIEPKYSIISVGKNNIYGHPNNEVLNNLKNSKIYRTDKDGSILFEINDNKLKIETYIP